MSGFNGFEMSVKDYAAQRGKTVQAVYQQMKRKENSTALTGHIFIKRIGNKDVKYLDEVAVSILDKASSSAPVVYLRTDAEEKLVAANQQIEFLKQQYKKLEGRAELLQEQLAEKEKKLLQLEVKEKEIEILEGFIQDAKAEIEVQKAQNAVLSSEKQYAIDKASKSDAESQRVSEELLEAYKVIERLKNRNFFQRLFNLKF